MTPGELSRVQPASDAPRMGNVYLLRGFIGIWSYGIDELGQRINDSGVRASVFQDDQWSALAEAIARQYKGAHRPEPLVLVGHSYGADDAVRVARRLAEQGVTVDLVVTIDPVTTQQVPRNVRLCCNLYLPGLLGPAFPFLRGVPLEGESANVCNIDLRNDRRDLLEDGTDHFNIEKREKIHQEIVSRIQQVCPKRER